MGFVTSLYATSEMCSPPPCGEGVGVGVSIINDARGVPPSLTSRASFARLGPRKGGGNTKMPRVVKMRAL